MINRTKEIYKPELLQNNNVLIQIKPDIDNEQTCHYSLS